MNKKPRELVYFPQELTILKANMPEGVLPGRDRLEKRQSAQTEDSQDS